MCVTVRGYSGFNYTVRPVTSLRRAVHSRRRSPSTGTTHLRLGVIKDTRGYDPKPTKATRTTPTKICVLPSMMLRRKEHWWGIYSVRRSCAHRSACFPECAFQESVAHTAVGISKRIWKVRHNGLLQLRS